MPVLRLPRAPSRSAGAAPATRARRVLVVPTEHRRGVTILALVTIAVYALVSVARHYALETTAYDLGIFYEAVHHWAHFQMPTVAVKGVHDGFGPGFDLLGDHFHPILVLLAPTMWIWDHPVTLLVDQAVLMGVSVVPVWSFANRRLASARSAYLVAVAYALYWGLQEAASFDFHEIAFAVPLIALAIERIEARRFATAAVAIVLLSTVKEDLPLLAAFFGLYVAVHGRRWLLGAGIVVYGVVTYELITKLAIPYFAGPGRGFVYWHYDQLGPDLPSAVGHMLRHPVDTARGFVTPGVKWHTELMLLAPFGLLTLWSPLVLLLVPLYAERFFNSEQQFWVTGYHYSATLAPIVAMGAADGLARLLRVLRPDAERWARRLVPAAFAAAALALVAIFPFRELFTPRLWLHDAHVDAGWRAIATVPRGVRVAASDEIQPQLTDRDWAVLADGKPHQVDYVVLDTSQRIWPFPSVQAERSYADSLAAQGWRTVFDRDGYVVLKAPPP